MSEKSNVSLFKSILKSHFVLDPCASMTGSELRSFVEPKLDNNTALYVKFKQWLLEETDVTWQPKTSTKPSVYVGIKRAVKRDDLDVSKTVFTKGGRFFITAAPAAAPVMQPFINSIMNWKNRNDAQLVVLPANAHVRALQSQPTYFDSTVMGLADHFATTYAVNDNLVAVDLKILPQQRDPLFGLTEWGKDNIGDGIQSVIVASTRQRYETIPVSNTKLPRSMMSTGVCTEPVYQDNRIGYLACRDHVVGGIVVEVGANGFFHSRHVQAYEDGSFIDLSNADVGTGACHYMPDGTMKYVRAEALVCGDIHGALLDPKAWQATKEMAEVCRPKLLVLHDLHDGSYSNPHCKGKAITQALSRHKSLDEDLNGTKQAFEKFVALAKKIDAKVVVVQSNHDNFLERDLSSMDWKNDRVNLLTYAKLLVRQLEHKDALQNYVDPNNDALWLSERDDFYAGGFHLTNHGHRGKSGSKGNLKQFVKYVKSIIGHSHEPNIRNGSVQVGCLCQLDQDYNTGLKSWLHSNCFVFPGGKFLHVVILEGTWRG